MTDQIEFYEVEAYEIVFSRTGQVVARASSMKRARRARDRKDNEYGACAHFIRNAANGVSLV
jgi:hypothetical protein